MSTCRTEELSDDFYDFGPDDYAAVMSGYKNSHSRAEAGLKTGKLRERDRLAWAEKFPTTHVRIFMPDGHVVQVGNYSSFFCYHGLFKVMLSTTCCHPKEFQTPENAATHSCFGSSITECRCFMSLASKLDLQSEDCALLQAKFRTLDTVGAIKATIRSCLSEDVAAGKWYLYTTPPKQVSPLALPFLLILPCLLPTMKTPKGELQSIQVLKADQTTLLEAKLYPAAKLHLGLEKEASRILKPGIEALRSSVPLLAGNNKAEHTLDQPVVMETSTRPQIMSSSTAKSEKSKAPKWLKLSK